MPYIDTIGDVIRVTGAVVTFTGQVQEFGLHYACLVSGGTDSRPSVAATWDAAFPAFLGAFLDPAATYWGTRVALVKSFAAYSPVVTSPAHPGTGVTTTLPTQVRPLVSTRTALAGRHFRGRAYFPTPVTAALSTLGHPTFTYLTALANYTTAAFGNIAAAGTTWTSCIFHRPGIGPLSNTFNLITTLQVSDRWATQRRSGDYGRPNPPPW